MTSKRPKALSRLACRLRPPQRTLPNFVLFVISALVTILSRTNFVNSEGGVCQFHSPGDSAFFRRIPETLRVGTEIFQITASPRERIELAPLGTNDDYQMFTVHELDDERISIILAASLEEIVDSDQRNGVIKFKLVCQGSPHTEPATLLLTVYVEDENDHSPNFVNGPYEVSIDELTPVGLPILNGITAVDGDKPNTPNSDIVYSIVAGNENGLFALKASQTASLVLVSPLDFDRGPSKHVLRLKAQDRGEPPQSSFADVVITVLDNDDQDPGFTSNRYRATVEETTYYSGKPVRKRIPTDPSIRAFDKDTGINATLTYAIVSGNSEGYFQMDSQTGDLYLVKEIDRERLASKKFSMQISAAQVDAPERHTVALLDVDVLDINDNLPQFKADLYNISIMENLPTGFSVVQVYAIDRDEGENAAFNYGLEGFGGPFEINPVSGWLSVVNSSLLDREKSAVIQLGVYAEERKPNVVYRDGRSRAIVEVHLLDANDNNPAFIPSSAYEFNVTRIAAPGTIVGQVVAEDADEGANGRVIYQIRRSSSIQVAPAGNKQTPQASSEVPFQVDPHYGTIVVSGPLAPKTSLYTIFVEAKDSPENPSEARSAMAVVKIHVVNVNRNPPKLLGNPVEFWIGSQVPVGTVVGQIQAHDPDQDVLEFDLLHKYREGVPFAIEENTGIVALWDKLESYDRVKYEFQATVSDGNHTTTGNVTIHVVLADDSKLVDLGPYEFRVMENLPNARLGKIRVRESKLFPIKFRISPGPDASLFGVEPDGTIFTKKGLDREQRAVHEFSVLTENARDGLQLAGVVQVKVVVEDDNDQPPVFSAAFYEGHILENSPRRTIVKVTPPIRVTDKDSPSNGIFTLSIEGPGADHFRMMPDSLELYVDRVPLDREERSEFHLLLRAHESDDLFSVANLTIYVQDDNDNAPNLSFFPIVVNDSGIVTNNVVDRFDGWEDEDHKNTTLQATDTQLTWSFSKPTSVHRNPSDPTMIHVPEDWTPGTKIGTMTAVDPDDGINGEIHYKIASELSRSAVAPSARNKEAQWKKTQYFKIDKNSGDLVPTTRLQPETHTVLVITATDGGGLENSQRIILYSFDVNDHAPVFDQEWYSFQVPEGNFIKPLLIGQVEAKDADVGQNGEVFYVALNRTVSDNFQVFVDESTGELYVQGLLDRETEHEVSLHIAALDRGNVAKKGITSVEILVEDANDNSPVFHGFQDVQFRPGSARSNDEDEEGDAGSYFPVYYAEITENNRVGELVAKVYANDSDFPGNGNGMVMYALITGRGRDNFEIDAKNGTIVATRKLDFEKEPKYELAVIAHDIGKPVSRSSTALVMVSVIDEREVIDGRFFSRTEYMVHIPENTRRAIGLVDIDVREDLDEHDFEYMIINTGWQGKFHLDPNTGMLSALEPLDRETRAEYRFRVKAQQKRHQYQIVEDGQDEVDVVIIVDDVNDNMPRFLVEKPFVGAVPKGAPAGYPVLRLKARDGDIGLNARVRYEIIPKPEDGSSLFKIEPRSGQIETKLDLGRFDFKVFGFDVRATDRDGAPDGLSSIANVFIYVIADEEEAIMTVKARVADVENHLDIITSNLTQLTGVDLRIRKIVDQQQSNSSGVKPAKQPDMTDVFLYGVDPDSNTILRSKDLIGVLTSAERAIENTMKMDIMGIHEPARKAANRPGPVKILLKTSEIAMIVIGGIIFLATVVTLVVICNIKQAKRRDDDCVPQPQRIDPMMRPPKHHHTHRSFSPMSRISETSSSYMEHSPVASHVGPPEGGYRKKHEVQRTKSSSPSTMATIPYGRHLLGNSFSASQPDVTMLRIQEERLKRHHSVPRHHHQHENHHDASAASSGERDVSKRGGEHRRKKCRCRYKTSEGQGRSRRKHSRSQIEEPSRERRRHLSSSDLVLGYGQQSESETSGKHVMASRECPECRCSIETVVADSSRKTRRETAAI